MRRSNKNVYCLQSTKSGIVKLKLGHRFIFREIHRDQSSRLGLIWIPPFEISIRFFWTFKTEPNTICLKCQLLDFPKGNVYVLVTNSKQTAFCTGFFFSRH